MTSKYKLLLKKCARFRVCLTNDKLAKFILFDYGRKVKSAQQFIWKPRIMSFSVPMRYWDVTIFMHACNDRRSTHYYIIFSRFRIWQTSTLRSSDDTWRPRLHPVETEECWRGLTRPHNCCRFNRGHELQPVESAVGLATPVLPPPHTAWRW